MPVTIKYYELTYNSDGTEGRGYSIVAARFVNKDDAVAVCNDERYWKKHGVMGTKMDPKYDVREVCGPLFESTADYWHYDVDEVKKKALAKLTDAEKKALGLPL
jgi:hypothetical protein